MNQNKNKPMEVVFVSPEEATQLQHNFKFSTKLAKYQCTAYVPTEDEDNDISDVIMDDSTLDESLNNNEGTKVRTWMNHETLALIATVKERFEDLHHPIRKKIVWKMICNALKASNIDATPKECNTKYRNLIRTYKKVKLTLNQNSNATIKFNYFYEMDDMLSNPEIKKIQRNSPERTVSYVKAQVHKKRESTKTYEDSDEVARCKIDYLKSKKALIDEERVRRKVESERKEARYEQQLLLEKEKREIEKQKLALLKLYLEKLSK